MRRLCAIALLVLLAIAAPSQVKLSGGTKTKNVKAATAGSSAVDFVNDSFTEASDIDLASHTPETGSTWVDHTDSAYPDTITLLGATDRIALNSVSGAAAYYNNAAPPSADYCAEGVL